ncbi:MAG: hypothetical protein ACO3PV_10295 [Pseudohongiellaceae bacterium]
MQFSVAGSILPDESGSVAGRNSDFRQKMVSVPGFLPPTEVKENLCPLPSCSQEDINEFRSAGVLMKALAAEARAWSEKLPADYRPAIMALLHGNLQMEVRSLAQVSFDGIRLEGIMDGNPCSVLAHQNTVQLMCYAERIDEDSEEEYVHHPIGFIWPDHNENI